MCTVPAPKPPAGPSSIQANGSHKHHSHSNHGLPGGSTDPARTLAKLPSKVREQVETVVEKFSGVLKVSSAWHGKSAVTPCGDG